LLLKDAFPSITHPFRRYRCLSGIRGAQIKNLCRKFCLYAPRQRLAVWSLPGANLSVWLALLSLDHPVRRSTCAQRTSRLCFSGSFRKKSCRQTQPSDKISYGCLPKKRRLPLGAGRLPSLRAWVGEWVSRTEWHRIVCFNKPAEYVKDFLKGDYVEVEGELRSSEFDSAVGEGKKKATVKRRSWEIRASIIRKLTRPARQEPENGSETETFTEDDAA